MKELIQKEKNELYESKCCNCKNKVNAAVSGGGRQPEAGKVYVHVCKANAFGAFFPGTCIAYTKKDMEVTK